VCGERERVNQVKSILIHVVNLSCIERDQIPQGAIIPSRFALCKKFAP